MTIEGRERMQAGEKGPVRWLKRVKRGPHLLLLKQAGVSQKQLLSVPDKPFLLCYSFFLQDCFALISSRFHLDKERRQHCDLPGKHVAHVQLHKEVKVDIPFEVVAEAEEA